MRSGLSGRAFRLVWAGESVSLLGDAAYTVAFVWLVLAETGSPGTLAGVLVAGAIPRGVLLLAGGAVVDRLSARTVLLGAHLARAVAVGALAAIAAAGSAGVPALAATAAVVGVADAFARPAGTAVLPTLVPAGQLPRANALVAVGEQVAMTAGPLGAAALVAFTSPAAVLAADAVTFAVAAATVLAAPRVPAAGGVLGALWPDVRDGLSRTLRNAELRAVLVVVAAATLSYAGLFGVGLPALADRSGGGPVALGLLLSGWGFGQLAGSVAAGVTGLPARWGLLVAGVSVGEAAVFTAVGLVPSVLVAAGLLAVLGVAVAYTQDVALPTWIQTRTPAEHLGRASSVLELPRVALEPLSLAAAGLLVAVDVRLAFAVAAVPVLAAGGYLLSSPAVRRLGTDPTSTDPTSTSSSDTGLTSTGLSDSGPTTGPTNGPTSIDSSVSSRS